MTKKSYMSLLKEAIAEFDTSDNVEVKGPMLDPILSWDGNGELPVYKDAASILERYYFDEGKDAKIRTLDEADYEDDNGNPASGPSMKNAKGDGTEQAGTSDAGTVKGGMDEKEKEIAKEAEEVEDGETDDEDEDDDKEMAEESLTMENAIIENKKIEEALAALEAEMADDDEEDEEVEKDLDIDKEVAKESSVPGGPSPRKTGEDWEDDEKYYAEAFNIFKEEVEDDADDDDDDDDETEDNLDEAWRTAIRQDAKSLLENSIDLDEVITEALTDREKTFLFGRIQRVFGDCAKKCGRIAVTSKQRACKDVCIAKRDQAIKAARAQAKSDKAAMKGKTQKAEKYAQKAKDIKSY